MTAMAIMLPVPLVTYTVNRREDCGSFVYDHLLIKMFNENGDSTNGMGFSIAAIRSAFLMGRRGGLINRDTHGATWYFTSKLHVDVF
jgi:hypothetical protein